MRARVGISNWLVEQALASELARRSSLAAAFPLPDRPLWTLAGWLGDLRSVAHGHALFSGCVAYLRDPRFFERATWPADLARIMSPISVERDEIAVAGALASVVAAATGRTRVRSLRGGGRWLSGLVRAGAAVAWGRAEAAVLTRVVERGMDEYQRERRDEVVEPARPRVVPVAGEAAA